MYLEAQEAIQSDRPTASNIEEVELLQEEFDQVVRENQRQIYRLLYALSRDAALADDLAQEVFLRAYKSRMGFRGDSSLRTWLRRISVNIFLDHANNRRASFWRRIAQAGSGAFERALDIPDEARSAESTVLQKEKVDSVWSVVSQLSPKQRTVFILYFGEDLTLDEIVQVTGMKLNTIKAHLARGIATVRKKIRGTDESLKQ